MAALASDVTAVSDCSQLGGLAPGSDLGHVATSGVTAHC